MSVGSGTRYGGPRGKGKRKRFMFVKAGLSLERWWLLLELGGIAFDLNVPYKNLPVRLESDQTS
jgi:hypothetical protein